MVGGIDWEKNHYMNSLINENVLRESQRERYCLLKGQIFLNKADIYNKAK